MGRAQDWPSAERSECSKCSQWQPKARVHAWPVVRVRPGVRVRDPGARVRVRPGARVVG